ncbi:uncharacterized protein N7482_002517 [Penicillium canariense]|uniref:Uncharacterized protein n=1 Tax=Penicillium canariense TaxID=189055 RepID=A0A9W9IG79_9EURO|nr:uncharacterized protein N7482_002517 [Penicillium canariense]KAJ5176640.1 hypothetical protein N7482_002517 [Penicillium canariense]
MTDPPRGWGTKPEDLEYEDDWEADDSVGQWLGAELNLGIGRPIMFHYRGLTYMFEAGGKFYSWYCIDLAVSEITSPTNLDEIIRIMKEKGEEALKDQKDF